MFQAIFGARSMVSLPQRLDPLFNSQITRFIVLSMIAYTATRQVEIAVLSTAIFIALLWLIRTPEERKKYGLL